MFFWQSDNKNLKIMPFFEGLAYPMAMINNHFKLFFCLACLVSFIEAGMILLLGRSSFCSIIEYSSEYGVFCSNQLLNVLISLAVMLCGLSFFVSRWQRVLSGENNNFKELIMISGFKQDLKTLFVVVMFFLLWIIEGVGFMMLYTRQPLPDWKQEIVFFVAISAMMIVALVLLLNFVMFQHYLKGGKFWVLPDIFWKMFDNVYKIIIWFFVYTFVFMYLYRVLRIFFNGMQFALLRAFGYEFFLCFLICFIGAITVSSLEYQNKKLFKVEE